MSQDGQPDNCGLDPSQTVVVCTFPMPAGVGFDWHTHPDHQLAWAACGVLTVRTEADAWVLPPTRALWIPAEVRHETLSSAASTTMRTCYIRRDLDPMGWTEPTPVGVSALLAELINYLETESLPDDRRANAESVLVDLLTPVAMTTIDVRFPTDERAARVAAALSDCPSDPRTLAEWGRDVGASSRTLARSFQTETGVPFGRWRALVRVRAAMVALGSGEPVANVARKVGYESTSAFVAAFRRETGVTPSAYFRVAAAG